MVDRAQCCVSCTVCCDIKEFFININQKFTQTEGCQSKGNKFFDFVRKITSNIMSGKQSSLKVTLTSFQDQCSQSRA